MNHRVSKDSARLLDVRDRGRHRIAADDDDLFDMTDRVGKNGVADLTEGGIEAHVEAEIERHAGLGDYLDASLDTFDIEADRLLAENGLTGIGRRLGLIDVCGRRTADEDGADRIVGERRFASGERFRTERLGESLGRIEIGIDNTFQPGLRMAGYVGGMNLANPASPKEAEIKHR